MNESKVSEKSRVPVDLKRVYARPTAFLPLDSAMPSQSVSAPQGDARRASIHAALLAVQRETAKINANLTHYMVSNSELNDSLRRLQGFVANADDLLACELAPLDGLHQQPAGALTEISGDPTEGRALDHVIYDTYFKVVRISAMTISQFTAQVVATCRAMLRDLPFAVLGMDQVLGLTETIQAMIEFLARRFASGEEDYPSPDENNISIPDDSAQQEFWLTKPETSSRQLDDRTGRVAFYRWCVGHHFFNLSSIFCASHLSGAGKAMEKSDEERAAKLIKQAGQFIRGLTAAMFYAANFPSEVYRGVIRESMMVTGAPHGFSGSQNADYSLLKTIKTDFMQRLAKSYGSDTSIWPPAVLAAVRTFQELDVQDSEHHVLLAAYKVGADSSLSQKTWHGRLPAQARVKNAVDILRDMAEHKRRQYQI